MNEQVARFAKLKYIDEVSDKIALLIAPTKGLDDHGTVTLHFVINAFLVGIPCRAKCLYECV